MPRASPGLLAFNAGEWSPRLEGRIDLERYPNACRQLKNFMPFVQGGVQRRPGFRFVREVADSSKETAAIPFEFSNEQAYILEVGEGYIRFSMDGGTVLESSIAITNVDDASDVEVTTGSSHGYANGDTVRIEGSAQDELNGRFFVITVTGADTFTLDGEDGTGRATGSGGTVARLYEILDGVGGNSIPWLTAEVNQIQIAQSADVLYLAHPNHPPHKISRTGHTSWTSEEIAFAWPPFLSENLDKDDTITASEYEGTVTLTSSGGHFNAGQVGSYLRLSETLEANYPEWVADRNIGGDNEWRYANTQVNAMTPPWAYYEGNVYELVDQPTSTGGHQPPVHRDGVKSDGVHDWKFIHSGAGYVKITAVADAFRATGVVQNVGLPLSAVYADRSISAITLSGTDPVRITTSSAHALETLDEVWIQDVGGTIELNQQRWAVTRINNNVIDLTGTDSSNFTAYTTGGIVVITKAKSEAVAANRRRIDPWRWTFAAFSDQNGYPRVPAFFEDRLYWAGAGAEPQGLWGSRTARYEDYEEFDEDDSGLFFVLNADQVNVIEWMRPRDSLLVGTTSGEWVISGGGQPLTPNNLRAVRNSAYGSRAFVAPFVVEQVLLFVQRAGRKIRELVFDEATQSFEAPDLTSLAEHISRGVFKRIAFQQEPNRLIWAVLEDGALVSMTYERAEGVIAWHRHPIGGTDAAVESIAVIPHPDGDRDQLWAIVARTVNGATKRYIELLEDEWMPESDLEDAFFVDSGLTYDGSPETDFLGVNHLEGETLVVLADGARVEDVVVSGGGFSLAVAASVVQAGLGYESVLETLRIEGGAGDGVSQGKTGRIAGFVARLYQASKGLFYGESEAECTEEIKIAAGTLFDGDTEYLPWPGGWDQERRMCLKQTGPGPCSIIALFPIVSVSDRG